MLTLAIAGCSQQGATGPEESTEKGEGNREEAAQDEAVTLRVWIMETGLPEETEQYFEKVNKQFNEKHPNVKVEVQFIPWLSAHQNFITSIAGGNAPDIAEIGTTWNPEFSAMGALAEMDSYVKEWGVEGGWVPALEEVGTYDEKLYGIPWYAGVRQLVYNKDILEKAGVEPPETYDDLLEASKAIKEKAGVSTYPAIGVSQHLFLPMVWHFGGELAVQEENEGEMKWVSKISEAPAVEAFDYYANLYKEGYVPEGAVNWSTAETRKAFAQGDLAMTIDLPPGINAMINENPEIEEKIGVAPLPKGENNASFVGGSNLAVFEQSENKDLAAEYIRLLVEDENIREWATLTGFFPGTVSGLEDPMFTDDPTLSVFADAMLEGRTYPPSPSWGRFEGENLFVAAMQEIMLGKKTAQEALDEVAESMNKAFASE